MGQGLRSWCSDRKPTPYLNTVAYEDFPQLSPDSQWMADASDESGQAQVYIEAIPRIGTCMRVWLTGVDRVRFLARPLFP
jgi:hypothetical protein